MKKPKNKTIILACVFGFVLLGVLLSASAYAAPIKLNVNYPCIPAPGGCIDLNCIDDGTCQPTIANIIVFMFVAAIWIGGLVAFVSLIYTGIQFIVGGESPAVRAAARERLKNVVWGIVILLLTYLVLNFINPQIVNLKDPGLESPCTESMCYEQCVEDGVEPPECEAICSGGDKCYEKKEIGTPKSCTKLSQVECGERSDCKWDGKCVQDSGF